MQDSKSTSIPPHSEDNFTEPVVEKRWINTQDRISEILFGLIMALTFTCTIKENNFLYTWTETGHGCFNQTLKFRREFL